MSDNAAQATPTHSVGFNLATIAAILVLLGIGGAYLLDASARNAATKAHRLDTETTLTRSLGGVELEIPLAWFRYDEQRIEGFAKQIDLRLDLPLGVEGAITPIDITLMPRSRVRPSAALLDGVYLHQFMDEQLDGGPPGLVGKPLMPKDGYANEVVWYDALSANPFVAKCSAVVPGGTSQCLRTVHLRPGVAAIYTFPEAALVQWRTFDEQMEARLRQIGAL
ncbi:MAG: hypothetical protein ACO1OG_02970 [Devosia sp.]